MYKKDSSLLIILQKMYMTHPSPLYNSYIAAVLTLTF